MSIVPVYSSRNYDIFDVKELPDGTFVAYREHEPYFCFIANTAEEVRAKAKIALNSFADEFQKHISKKVMNSDGLGNS